MPVFARKMRLFYLLQQGGASIECAIEFALHVSLVKSLISDIYMLEIVVEDVRPPPFERIGQGARLTSADHRSPKGRRSIT